MPDSSSPPPDVPESPLVVFKFGGTSVGRPDRFRTVVQLIREAAAEGRVVAVVSALSGVSRQLASALEAVSTRADGATAVETLTDTLRTRHAEQAEAVLCADRKRTYEAILDERLEALRRAFERVEQDVDVPAARDAVLAVGEQLSVPMVTLALRDAGLHAPRCDATDLVVTDDTFGAAQVQHDDTSERVRAWYRSLDPAAVPVVAGFIGATEDGRPTTLGFEGSDYSAALFAKLLGAQGLTRYTDVDGIYTDDPEANEDAERVDHLSMEEALARSASGGLGMHPKTLRPLADAGIPMQVRSIVAPECPGTPIVPAERTADALWPAP
ncbi:aspartate kinase [Salinibacter ruber]|uniref:Aspartokinase n=1 Tax=Salinibacter ruber TaxID=146919 RepID=A0A9X2V4X3_9BACT|nr:aspartate kinase [Salinibacter ruber]